jgi:hypothetical protein
MKEADSAIVALYRYVVRAGRPVTFEEIIENALPPQMRSAAYRKWNEHAKAAYDQDIEDAHWEKESNKNAALRWWIGDLVQTSVHTKRFSVNAQDGSPVNGQRRESLLYSPGPRPPRVRYADGKVRPWTVELDHEYERAAAAQRIVQRTDAIKARVAAMKAKPLTDKERKDLASDLASHLDDAYKAVKVVPPRP